MWENIRIKELVLYNAYIVAFDWLLWNRFNLALYINNNWFSRMGNVDFPVMYVHDDGFKVSYIAHTKCYYL